MNAIIIDDEKTGTRGLELLVKKHCHDIQVVAIEHTAEDGIRQILHLQPDLIFLDIELPSASGFDVIAATQELTYQVIFTTAYEQYAIKALRAQAADYLLKPIDSSELIQATERARLRSKQLGGGTLHAPIKTPANTSKKIPIATGKGTLLVDQSEILYLESESNYTTVFLKSGQKILVSKTLKHLEERLDAEQFCRVHATYLVNLLEVEQYIRGDGGYLVLKTKMSIPVSRTYKALLLTRLGL